MGMVFIVVCPRCGYDYSVDAAIRDAEVLLECPKCRRKFDIPDGVRRG